MRELRFYGASDDLFEIDGFRTGEPDELCGDGFFIVKIDSPSEGSVCVVGHYAPNDVVPCWAVGLMPTDEGEPIPPWHVRYDIKGHDYSAVLVIEVPDDAVLSEVK